TATPTSPAKSRNRFDPVRESPRLVQPRRTAKRIHRRRRAVRRQRASRRGPVALRLVQKFLERRYAGTRGLLEGRRELVAGVELQLAEDARQVTLDRSRRDEQALRDLAVREALA